MALVTGSIRCQSGDVFRMNKPEVYIEHQGFISSAEVRPCKGDYGSPGTKVLLVQYSCSTSFQIPLILGSPLQCFYIYHTPHLHSPGGRA